MDQDQLVEDFFRSLRVALTNAFSYSKDHPYFVKSVENFKLKLEETLAVLNPLKIEVTSLGLVVDGKKLTRIGFYDELARLLHQRKIESIEIKSGASLQELIQFLGAISLPQKEFFKKGGLNAFLKRGELAHFRIQELDYSIFLHGVGQECTDVWGYMLKEAVSNNNVVKIDQLADNFGPFIKGVNEKDFFDAEDISTEVNEFLSYLSDKNKEKHNKCLNDIFLWLLRNKKTLNQDKLEKLKSAFNGLSEEEFTTLLKEGFLQEDNFDSLSLQLFSKISGQEDSSKIAKNFFSEMHEMPGLKDNPVVEKKIRNLLSSSPDDPMSAVYRNTLDSLVKNISFSGNLSFDHQILKENYRYIVLGILATDENTDTLQMVAAILEKELASVFEDNDVDFLKNLWDLLIKRKKEGINAVINLERSLSLTIENMALNGTLTLQQEFLLQMVYFPGKEMSLYLDKIFTAEKVNNQVVSLFLRLFPANLDDFYKCVDQKMQDTEFLAGLIEALSQADAPVTISILEYIYSGANELIKVESLKAMRKLKKVDTKFLLRQLNTDSFSLKRELFSVLVLDAQAENDILDLLFKVSSFLGSKNELLIENMQIAFDLQIVQAVSRIHGLSCRRFFWNRKLRAKAKQILKEWNAH